VKNPLAHHRSWFNGTGNNLWGWVAVHSPSSATCAFTLHITLSWYSIPYTDSFENTPSYLSRKKILSGTTCGRDNKQSHMRNRGWSMNVSEYSFRYAPVQAIFLDQRAIKYMTKWYTIL
jgi:hypothetical protein